MQKIQSHFLAAVSGAIIVLAILTAAVPEAYAEDSPLPDHFGRMFNLPPFAPPTDAVRAALLELGKAGGILDANDNLAAGPKALIIDPALSVNNPNNLTHTAG